MPDLVKGFLQGSMNKDADERILPEGQYRDAENVHVFNQEDSSTGTVHNALGNTMIADLAVISGQALTNAKTIGAVVYEAKNLIYWLVSANTFDGIYEYNKDDGTTVRVLQSNKPTPNDESKLNFKQEYPVTGINYVPGRNGENYLYWTDDYNPPRRININRAKSYSIDDDRIDIDIDVIVKPPLYAPAIYPYLDTTDPNSNNMKEKFITFSYRWKNVDGQYSALAPFSAVSFRPGEYSYDYGVGNNKSMTNSFNAVKIVCETGDEFVDEIQIVLKDTRKPNANIVETISKSKLNINDNASYTFDFKNNKTYTVLPLDQVTRLFDNVPLLAKSQEIIGNRLGYGNYLQFRDMKDSFKQDILMDLRLSVKTDNTATLTDPKQTWRSDRDYEVGIIYGDDYGRMTTVMTSPNSSAYVPPANSVTANTLKLQINNPAPEWATNYRVVVKQSRGGYYNLFPITFYSDGLFRYFLIHQSDVDKIKVGDYIIFKMDTDGATKSNKKYKILEIENKSADFLNSGTTTELEGIYFKIKVDSISELSDTNVINFSSSNRGWNANWAFSSYLELCSDDAGPKPFVNGAPVVERPIYYGSGNPNRIQLNSNIPLAVTNCRVVIEGNDDGTISYYVVIGPMGSPVYVQQNITPTTTTPIYNNYGTLLFNINVASGTLFDEFDRWAITVRDGYWGSAYSSAKAIFPGNSWSSETIFPGAVIKLKFTEEGNPSAQPEMVFPPSPSYYDNIEEWWYETSAKDYFKYYQYDGTLNGTEMKFYRGSYLEAQNNDYPGEFGNQIDGGGPVSSATLSLPVRMVVVGSVSSTVVAGAFNNPCKQFYFQVDFSIRQQSKLTVCETAPTDTDLDVYHEIFHTHRISSGEHKVLWTYDDFVDYNGSTMLTQLTPREPHYFAVGDSVNVISTNNGYMPSGTYTISQINDQHSVVLNFAFPGANPATPGRIGYSNSLEQDQSGTSPAIIEINKPQSINSEYNAWCYGNGIETDRILDDYNETTKQFSIRAYTPFEGYKQVRNEASICYSGIYSENSSLNRLNEFNLSTSNFKHLEKAFGPIQKLDARDTDLLVFQENKTSKVLYEKNVLYDSVGGGQVVSIPEVLGTQIAFPGEYGISKNPESFDKWGNDRFFTDQKNGVVLQLTGDSIIEISQSGMKDYFRDLLNNNPDTEKLGAFDPHNRMYVLASTDQSLIPCNLSISREKLSVSKDMKSYFLFSIETTLPWTLTVTDTGDGTNWVSDSGQSGVGPQNIYTTVTQNNGTTTRSVSFVVTYCDGLTEEFVLTQARGKKGRVIVGVIKNNIDKVVL